ncbi:MAG: hypothetical protein IPK83_01175 [Planctomycetes bacterium]|nr:hypothetical protein [Planctomycetota bacterium]
MTLRPVVARIRMKNDGDCDSRQAVEFHMPRNIVDSETLFDGSFDRALAGPHR